MINPKQFIPRTNGWVAGMQRQVETWSAPGLLLRVAGGSDFYIGPDGRDIVCVRREQEDWSLSETDRQILLPVLVLALALRNTWSLHASAAIFKETVFVFLGESGQGKSTLAVYLGKQPGWRCVADDILPVTLKGGEAASLAAFPTTQTVRPGTALVGFTREPPTGRICLLTRSSFERNAGSASPVSHRGRPGAARPYRRDTHVPPDLLDRHLAFFTSAAGRVPVYSLKYPHR